MKSIRIAMGIMLVASLSIFASAPAAASDGPSITATLAGNAIALNQVAQLDCHDVAYPTIRCFTTDAARDADAARVTQRQFSGQGGASIAATVYVEFYQHENFNGASFATTGAISNLTNIGWNDAITSFRSLNGGHPKWWIDANFSSSNAQWQTGASVANVGGAWNDEFSSVQNVP